MSLLTQSSHLSCGLPLSVRPSCFSTAALFASLLASILTKWPAHLILLLTNLPVRLHCIPTSFPRSFILLLFTLFVLVIRRTQLFSHNCSFCCCCSVNATVSRPYRHAGVTHVLRTFFSLSHPDFTKLRMRLSVALVNVSTINHLEK